MRYQEFVNQIVEQVRSEVDDRASVTVRPIRRNNDFSSDGLNIVRDANLFSPTVFLDECYDDYLKGRDIDHIVSDITGFYHSHEKVHSLDISYFYDFHEVSPHLAVKLINYERNAELLREVPYERFLDLAVVCYCLVEHTVFGAGSILVKKAHLDYWGVTKAALFQTAMENTLQIQPCSIRSMQEVLHSIIDTGDCPQLYILSNRLGYYGAAGMLYPKIMGGLSEELGKDLFILPSSVDEVLLLPDTEGYAVDDLKQMVLEINRTYVSKDCFLSNSVYRYSREEKNVKVL